MINKKMCYEEIFINISGAGAGSKCGICPVA